ncbi:MAG TPA: 5,10-methylenetetrahydrofolate reductase, partial [Thermotoga naphthophila]|nr:5,10-methylenetetrahydrofolate reductase [Thermotoga petrophila]
FMEFTEEAWKTGIDAFTVTDMPMGRVRMAPWAASHLLVESGKDVLM